MPDASPTPAVQSAPNDESRPWDSIIEQLKDVRDNPEMKANWPKITHQIDRLLNEVERVPAALDDVWFRTRVAYVVSDMNRIAGGRLVLPPAARSEIEGLAISSPALDNDTLANALRLSGQLGREAIPLLEELRHQARLYVEKGAGEDGVSLDRIAALEKQVVGQLAGGSQPQPAAATAAATLGASAATAIMDALAHRPGPAGPPPWQGVKQGLANRLASYRGAQADRRSNDLHAEADSAAKAAVHALGRLQTGPASDVLRKVATEANADPNGVAGVISATGGKA